MTPEALAALKEKEKDLTPAPIHKTPFDR